MSGENKYDFEFVPYGVHVDPFPGESLFGFLDRVVQENVFPCRFHVIEDLNSRNCRYSGHLTEEELRRLSLLTEVDQKILAGMQSAYTTGSTQFFGHEIPKWFVDRTSASVCPECLREGSFHKMIWSFRPIQVCLIHHVKLLTSCPDPDCGAALRWRYTPHSQCTCGFDFASAQTEPANENEIQYGHFMQDLLSLSPEDAMVVNAPFLPREIASWTIGKFLQILSWILALTLNLRPGNNRRRTPRDGMSLGDYQAAYEMLRSWPNLLQRYKPLGNKSRKIVRRFDADLHKLLLKEGTDLSYYDAAMLDTFGGEEDTPPRLQFGLQELIDAPEGAEITGLPLKRFEPLALRRGWRFDFVRGNKPHKPYDANKVREWAEQNKAISIENAGKLLGLGRWHIINLHEQGWISCIDAAEFGWHRTYLRYPDVAKFQAYLDNPDLADTSGRLVSMSELYSRSRQTLSCAFILICGVKGMLRPVGPRPARTANLLFRAGDVGRWLRFLSEDSLLPDKCFTPFIRQLMRHSSLSDAVSYDNDNPCSARFPEGLSLRNSAI